MLYPQELMDFINKNKSFINTTHQTFLSSRSDPQCAFYKIQFDFNSDLLLNECKKLDSLFIDHRKEKEKSGYGNYGWQSLTLHGIDVHKSKHYVHYGFKSFEEAGYHWTDVCDKVPNLSSFLQSLPFTKFHRVRILRLASGGYIMPHTDGVSRSFGPLNIAINNPEGCQFIFEEKGIVPFEPGVGMVLDVARKHAVINQSSKTRYHVIVHGEYSVGIVYL